MRALDDSITILDGFAHYFQVTLDCKVLWIDQGWIFEVVRADVDLAWSRKRLEMVMSYRSNERKTYLTHLLSRAFASKSRWKSSSCRLLEGRGSDGKQVIDVSLV